MIDLSNEVYIVIPDDLNDLNDYFPGWYIARLTKQNRHNRIIVNNTNKTRKGTTGTNRIRLLRIFDGLINQITDQIILSNPLVNLVNLESRTEGNYNAIN